VQLYLCLPFMPSLRGQGQIYISTFLNQFWPQRLKFNIELNVIVLLSNL